MNVLKAVALATNCFVLGVAHFGKNLEKGIRGNSSREDAGDLVLACLGDRTVSGSVYQSPAWQSGSIRVARKGRNSRSRCGRWRRPSR